VKFLLVPLLFAAPAFAVASAPQAPWVPDRGDHTYQNPVLFADYSDPDAIRVGRDFYLVSSSFHATPGLPILHSFDLVNWEIINHALPRQVPEDHFSVPRHGEGVWAPAIRYHAGKFWIYYPDPDFGIYVVTASDPAKAWSGPVLVLPGKGLIDPCPLWDDDGQGYLIHAWARSRSGISNRLTLHRLGPEGTTVVDAGTVVVDADKLPGWTTLEGPKLYRRHGYYYIFAPAGGVTRGYQAVFRSRNIHGPYENRIVLDQGRTEINGPHQGAWVDTPTGQDWFLHFQDRGAFGRVVHLEPMAWRDDDWPVIGSDPGNTGKGEPVLTHAKPEVGGIYPSAVPQTSDEFDGPALGLQWQWNANPRREWASLDARPHFLRLNCLSLGSGNLYDAPNLLLQKFPAPAFTATAVLEFSPAASGEDAGLVVFGYDFAWIGLRSTPAGAELVQVSFQRVRRAPGAIEVGPGHVDDRSRILPPLPPLQTSSAGIVGGPVFLRVTVDAVAACHFSYSRDGLTFFPLGPAFPASVDRWIGAKVGLFASAGLAKGGYADFDWFRVTP
jgi:beta-xylosidase